MGRINLTSLQQELIADAHVDLMKVLSRALKYLIMDVIVVIRECITPHVLKNYKSTIHTGKDRVWCVPINSYNRECGPSKWELALAILAKRLREKSRDSCPDRSKLKVREDHIDNGNDDDYIRYRITLSGAKYVVSFPIDGIKLEVVIVNNKNDRSEELLHSIIVKNINVSKCSKVVDNVEECAEYKVASVNVNVTCTRIGVGVRSRCNASKIKIKIKDFIIDN